MATENIRVRASYGENKSVVLNTSFDFEMPSDLDAAKERFGAEAVYGFFKANLVVVLQSQARKLMTDAWETLTNEEKNAVSVYPEKEGGVTVATLPDEAQKSIQDFFSVWTPDTKLGRRAAVRPQDAVRVLMDGWDKMSQEHQLDILRKLQDRFGVGAGVGAGVESDSSDQEEYEQ